LITSTIAPGLASLILGGGGTYGACNGGGGGGNGGEYQSNGGTGSYGFPPDIFTQGSIIFIYTTAVA
jgi:hypothetical protein